MEHPLRTMAYEGLVITVLAGALAVTGHKTLQRVGGVLSSYSALGTSIFREGAEVLNDLGRSEPIYLEGHYQDNSSVWMVR